MDGVEPELFPRLARYAALLPQGLLSHPDSQVRGSVCRIFQGDGLPPEVVATLPEVLQGVFRRPPLVDFPPYLFIDSALAAVGTGMAAALEMSRAKDPHVRVASVSPTRGELDLTWS